MVVAVPLDLEAQAVTEAQMRELVSATFAAGWDAAHPDIPLALDNEAIALPAAGSFAALTVTPTTSQQQTAGRRGARRVTRQGWIVVKLWVLADSGTAALAGLVATVRNLFELVDLPSPVAGDDALVTSASNQQPGGPSTDGKWFMQLVRTPFTYTEQR
jgi:hypothetical protein